MPLPHHTASLYHAAMLIWLTVSCAVTAPPVAVIGLGSAKADAVKRVQAAEPNAMPIEEMWRVLAGTDDPRTPSAEGLERMLADARDREARFDTAGANELRTEIARAFLQAVRPTDAVIDVAARAAHDTAATLLAENKRAEALRNAASAVRSFPDTPVDATRHPPPVHALFERARENVATQPRGRLRIEADAPGTIKIDGFTVGRIDGVLEPELPIGSYRVWWVGDSTSSLPHAVELTAAGATLTIAARHEWVIRLRPVVSIDCTSVCNPHLHAIGQQLGVTRVIGVRSGAPGIAIDVATGKSTPWPPNTEVDESITRAQFSPWYLVPFGVGQFAQDRPVFGSTYAAGQVALLVWHLVAWRRHADAVESDDFGREPDLRSQRNLSAGLFYGALATSVAEALIVGWVTGE